MYRSDVPGYVPYLCSMSMLVLLVTAGHTADLRAYPGMHTGEYGDYASMDAVWCPYSTYGTYSASDHSHPYIERHSQCNDRSHDG